MKTLQLGHKLKDSISGFAGIAQSHTLFLTGNEQFTLMAPLAKDGKLLEASFDTLQLDYVSPGNVNRVVQAPADTGIELGWKVEDIVTGFQGIAVHRVTFINGCVYFTVVSKITPDNKGADEMFLEYKRLKKVSAGVSVAIANKEPSGDAKPPGGPAYSVPRRG
jgi:hypothetical protein